MRRAMFWIGCTILCVILPAAYGVQAYMFQSVPPMQPWIWLCLGVSAVLIFFGRNRDDVFKHHLA